MLEQQTIIYQMQAYLDGQLSRQAGLRLIEQIENDDNYLVIFTALKQHKHLSGPAMEANFYGYQVEKRFIEQTLSFVERKQARQQEQKRIAKFSFSTAIAFMVLTLPHSFQQQVLIANKGPASEVLQNFDMDFANTTHYLLNMDSSQKEEVTLYLETLNMDQQL